MLERLRYIALRAGHAVYYRIRRRFTPAGWMVLSAIVVTAALGVDTNESVAYQVFCFFCALTGLSLLWGVFSRGGFEVVRHLPRFGTVGQPLPYRVSVRNLSGSVQRGFFFREDPGIVMPRFEEFRTARPERGPRGLMDRIFGLYRWEFARDRRRVCAAVEKPLPDLPPNGECELSPELVPVRRGRMTLGRGIIARPDPFGLFKSFRRAGEKQPILVLPKRYPVPRLSLPGSRRYQQGGVALASQVGESQEFMSLRDYKPGDPLRRIHWRSLAKIGKPVVKEFQDEYFVRHALVLDTFTSPARGAAFEEAVSVAASFACTVLTQESLLDLLFVGDETYCLTAGRGVAGADKMLEVLASVRPCGDKPFEELHQAVLGRRASLSGCICVLMELDDKRRDFLRALRSLGVPVSAVVIVELGETPEELEGARVLEVGKVGEGLAVL